MWVILDGGLEISTGCSAGDAARAEEKFAVYLASKFAAPGPLAATQLRMDQILAAWLAEYVPHSPSEQWLRRMIAHQRLVVGQDAVDGQGRRLPELCHLADGSVPQAAPKIEIAECGCQRSNRATRAPDAGLGYQVISCRAWALTGGSQSHDTEPISAKDRLLVDA